MTIRVVHSNIKVYECEGALFSISKERKHNLKQGKTPRQTKLKRLNECIKRGLKVYQPDKTNIVGLISTNQASI